MSRQVPVGSFPFVAFVNDNNNIQVPVIGTAFANLNGSVPTAFTIWNSNDIVNGSIDSSGLIYTTPGGNGGVRSVDSYASGQYYFEVTLTVVGSGSNNGVGISIGGASFTALGNNGTGGAMQFGAFGGTTYINGSNQSPTLGTASNGDVICVAFDATAKLFWVRRNAGNWNGSGTANPATGTGGYSIAGITGPYYAALTSNSASVISTANFGASAFAQTVPTGFTAGLPSNIVNQVGLPFDGLKRKQIRNELFYQDEQLQDGWQDPRMRKTRNRVDWLQPKLAASKTVAYTVTAQLDTGISTSKTIAYAAILPVNGVNASKTVMYAVMEQQFNVVNIARQSQSFRNFFQRQPKIPRRNNASTLVPPPTPPTTTGAVFFVVT